MLYTSFRSNPMKPVEYEFILTDGSKRYEFIDPDNDMSVMQQI